MRKLAVLAAAASILMLTASSAAEASAAVRPSATFAFVRASVPAGTSATLSYATAGLPAGAHVSLQLRYGSPAAWISIESLHADGITRVPRLPAGTYLMRLRVFAGQVTLAVSADRVLTVSGGSGGSGCSVLCQLLGPALGGAAGAAASWLLQDGLPWLVSTLPWF